MKEPIEKAKIMNLFELSHLLVRRRRFMVGSVAVGTLFVGLVTLLVPNKYISHASILPTGGRTQLEEMKEQFGLQFGPERDDNSSELFPVILKSQSIAQEVLNKEYVFNHDDQVIKVSLPEYFGDDNPDELYRSINEVLAVSVAKRTGVIDLSIETRYPGLSQAVLAEYLNRLEHYNVHRRSSQAGQYAVYLRRELETSSSQLDSSENRLSEFQAANRNWATTTDPELAKELTRLQRDATVEAATFSFLRRELEMAELDAQKDIPVIRILDTPTFPYSKSSPKRTLIVLLCGVIITCGVLGGVVAWESLRHDTLNDQRDSFESLRSDVQRAFPRSLRFIKRISGEKLELSETKQDQSSGA